MKISKRYFNPLFTFSFFFLLFITLTSRSILAEAKTKIHQPLNKKNCNIKNGCNPLTSDHGKECKDISECEGECIVNDITLEEKKLLEKGIFLEKTGECGERHFIYGCFYRVDEGKVKGEVCEAN